MSTVINKLQALFLSFFLTFNTPTSLTPSVQPISDPEGISFCTAFSVNEPQRLYLTAAHCIDSKEVDLPIPLMFQQRIQVLKADYHVDIALIRAALGAKGIAIATFPPGPGSKTVGAGFIGGQHTPMLMSAFSGIFVANAMGMDEHHELLVFSAFGMRAEHGMSGGPILNEEGEVVSIIQLKFPDDITGGILLQFIHTFLSR